MYRIIIAYNLLILLKISSGATNVKIEELLKPDSCDEFANNGDTLSMHYTGSLATDGKVFDSSYVQGCKGFSLGKPLEFELGAGMVIKGWDRGVQGMCKGEKRRLTVPADLAYGSQGVGGIPPGSDLIFEVELVELKKAKKQKTPNMFKQMDVDFDKQISKEEMSDFFAQHMEKKTKTKRLTQAEKDQIKMMRKHMVDQSFDRDDGDKDGFITFDEFSGPKHDEL